MVWLSILAELKVFRWGSRSSLSLYKVRMILISTSTSEKSTKQSIWQIISAQVILFYSLKNIYSLSKRLQIPGAVFSSNQYPPCPSSCRKFGKGKPLQYPCLENPMNSMKRQKDMTLEDEPPRLVGSPSKLQGKSREIVPERMCISIFYKLRLVAVHHCTGDPACRCLIWHVCPFSSESSPELKSWPLSSSCLGKVT